MCVCVGFFSTWFKQQHASTFLNWWALITQSAHITRYSFDEQGNRLLFKRLLLQDIAKASEKKPSHFFSWKKNPTNEKANEFDYLPNLFEIIPTIIFLWSFFFLVRLFRFFNHHNEWRESKVYNRMLKEIMRSEAQANSLNVNIIITDGAREREKDAPPNQRCSYQPVVPLKMGWIRFHANLWSAYEMSMYFMVQMSVCLSVYQHVLSTETPNKSKWWNENENNDNNNFKWILNRFDMGDHVIYIWSSPLMP